MSRGWANRSNNSHMIRDFKGDCAVSLTSSQSHTLRPTHPAGEASPEPPHEGVGGSRGRVSYLWGEGDRVFTWGLRPHTPLGGRVAPQTPYNVRIGESGDIGLIVGARLAAAFYVGLLVPSPRQASVPDIICRVSDPTPRLGGRAKPSASLGRSCASPAPDPLQSECGRANGRHDGWARGSGWGLCCAS